MTFLFQYTKPNITVKTNPLFDEKKKKKTICRFVSRYMRCIRELKSSICFPTYLTPLNENVEQYYILKKILWLF